MRQPVLLAVGACAALLLQIIIAPNIGVLGAMPNFVLVYVIGSAMLMHDDSVIIAAFAVGMLFDLIGGGTPGIMAALLTAAAFVTERVSALFGADNLGAPLVASMVMSMVVEVCYAFFFISATGASFFDAVILRALPCALYDCAMTLIVFPVLAYLFKAAAPAHDAPTSSTIRLR